MAQCDTDASGPFMWSSQFKVPECDNGPSVRATFTGRRQELTLGRTLGPTVPLHTPELSEASSNLSRWRRNKRQPVRILDLLTSQSPILK